MTTPHERAALVAEAREQATVIRDFLPDEADDDVTAALLDRLATALEESARDTERLDWLDRQRGDVTGEDQYGELELQGHGWGVYGVCADVRTAIDAASASAPVPDGSAPHDPEICGCGDHWEFCPHAGYRDPDAAVPDEAAEGR